MSDARPTESPVHLTAHALARMLLEGPDIPVFFEDERGSAPVIGLTVCDRKMEWVRDANGKVVAEWHPVPPTLTVEGAP